MKSTAFRDSKRIKGFTLVELLVSISILTVMLVFLGQAIGYVSNLWINGIGAVDNFSKARVITSIIDRDVEGMVMRPDTAAFVDQSGNQACAFYTNIQGNPGTYTLDRSVSLVQYTLDPLALGTTVSKATLGRRNYGMNFSNPGVLPTFGTTTKLTDLGNTSVATDTLATGVIRFQWQFVDGAGNFINPATTPYSYSFLSPSAPSNPRAIIISLLVLSNSAFQSASQNSTTMNTLFSDFPNTLPVASPNQTFSQYWNGILNPTAGNFDTSLPPSVRGGLKVFQRYVPLPVPAP